MAQERNKILKIRDFFMHTNPSWKLHLTYPAIFHINKGIDYKKSLGDDECVPENAEDFFRVNNT